MTSHHLEFEEPTRRSFLFVTTGAVAAVGVPFAAWPLIDQMSPDAAVNAHAHLDINLGRIPVGVSILLKRGDLPMLIRHRTSEEIQAAGSVQLWELQDQRSRNAMRPRSDASDANRTIQRDGKFIVLIPVCTRHSCLLIGDAGEFNAWFCPCCGSHYDTSGRVRSGPAPENLWIPEHEFTAPNRLRINGPGWRYVTR